MPACLKNLAGTFRTGETKATKPQHTEETRGPFLRAACNGSCFHVYTVETRQRLWLGKENCLCCYNLYCSAIMKHGHIDAYVYFITLTLYWQTCGSILG